VRQGGQPGQGGPTPSPPRRTRTNTRTTTSTDALTGHPAGVAARLPHLHLDYCRELALRRVPDHHQLALDDDRLRHVQTLVRLAWREGDRPQNAGRADYLDEDAAGNHVNRAGGHEDEASGSRLHAAGVKVRKPDGADRGAGRD
jgi:hypothetical protein